MRAYVKTIGSELDKFDGIGIALHIFEKQKKFKSVDEYRRHRSSQETAPISLQQSRQYLKDRESQGTEDDTRRNFSIIKRDQEIAEGNKKWWGHLQRLK